MLATAFYQFPLWIYSKIPLYKHYGRFDYSLFSALVNWKLPNLSPIGLLNDLMLVYFCALALRREHKIILRNEKLFQLARAIYKTFARRFKKLTFREKNSFLAYVLKLYFLPMMLSFLIGNISAFGTDYRELLALKFLQISIADINRALIPLLFHCFLVIDVSCFVIGYGTESKRLNNVIKSVEPTLFGWFVALICYNPFMLSSLIGWYSSDFAKFESQNLCLLFNILGLILFGIYTWASVALGTKCSNLTNRGIISSGPYKFVRHPAYFCKNLAWWLMAIPFIGQHGIKAAAVMAVITLIYFLRAITEERHLSRDPDYLSYKKKVPYRFIPRLI